jgi:two-component system nitrogen regulation sensor histidine kinase NtrY
LSDESFESAQRITEQKRRRRELLAVGVTLVTLVAFILAQTELPPLSSHTSLVSNLVVVLLFDLSFLLLGLLLFLVGRNLAKAFFERQRGLIGSRLQFRLVFGFIAVALVPAAFLLYVAGSFLHTSVDSWFNPEYERVIDDALEIAKVYYLNSANSAEHFARALAHEVSERGLLKGDRTALKRYINAHQQEYDLGTIEIFSRDRKLLLFSLSPESPTGIGIAPDSTLLTSTLAGHAVTRTDRFGKSDVVRGSAPIFASSDSDAVIGAVVVDYYLPRSIADRAAGISHAFEDYFQLRILHQPILRSYFIALVLIGLVIVMLASWFGLYLARGITGPIRLLAQGTHAIASGDLNYEIPKVGDDEIGALVSSFNHMTADLRESRAELEHRRRYTETLLRNVSAGVVGLDPDGRITTVNPWAARVLELNSRTVAGIHYRQAFVPPIVRALDEILASQAQLREARTSIKLDDGGATELMMTASTLGVEPDDSAAGDGDIGTVLFFEDVSQIAKVERMEAWREVARRIAHEIKNPLTPIQLCAERLRRQMHGFSLTGTALVDECTRVIIGEVEALKHLVNEFSAFARMPHLNPTPGDLNALAEEVLGTFSEAHLNVHFEWSLTPGLPRIAIDRDALKRALINLLDNAAAASLAAADGGGGPTVTVATRFEELSGVVTLEVADNGLGIEPRLRARIFEPYFSTKRGGTGLGLAIVSAIVSDHHGFVRVRDNYPRGSRFTLEFPVTNVTSVKLAG